MKIFGKEYKIVSEKDQKDKANTLYLYIENIDSVTYAKFGEAFKQTVWERYDATGYTQHSKQVKVWKSSVGDKPIHRLLRSMFTWAGNKSENPLNTNEAYIIKSSDELDRMIETITDIVKNQKIGPDFFRNRCENLTYSPRSYQQDIINKAQNVLSVKDRVLVNLSTRGGKSFVSLNICKNIIGKTKVANILILTPFPAAEGSFEEVANLHKDFKGWKYGSHKGDNEYYISQFDEQVLKPLTVEGVLEDIANLSGGDLDKVILLCYEKPTDFCHRHLVADWINKHKSINFIVEYSKGVI